MKLKVEIGYSGIEGAASAGSVIEVSEEKGKRMLAQGYPVSEVTDEGKRARGKARSNSQSPKTDT